MILNEAQDHYLQNLSKRNIILKARQLGFTTFCLIYMLDEAIVRPNSTHAIIAHKREDVQKIFRKIKIAYNNLPIEMKPVAKYDNLNELYFEEQNSTIYVATDIRGGTVNNLHFSEAAFTKDFANKYVASKQSVPKDGMITIETTANGFGNKFKDLWDDSVAGSNDFMPHFYGWDWDPEYIMPTEGVDLTDAELEYQALHKLSLGQMAWRRSQLGDLKELFAQEYPITAEEAFIATGGNIFDIEALKVMAAHAIEPVAKEEYLNIFKQPIKGRLYTMGTDTSSGNAAGDWQVTEVIDYETSEQVAELRCRVPVDRFADISIELGKRYNNALWGIEEERYGASVIEKAKRGYPNLYARRNQLSTGSEDKQTKTYGWRTDGKTKPIMIGDMNAAIREGSCKINSKVLINECMTYIEDPDTKQMDAAQGKHDDTVIAYAVALQMRKYVKRAPVASKVKPAGL